MSTENKSCAPRLRFPGFTGDWKEIVFGDVAGINRGGSPRPISNFLTTDPNGVNWIKIGDVEADAKYISHAEERIIPEGVSHSREVHSGDFLLSNSMSFGRPYILKIDGCIHDGWLVIQDYQDTFDKEFLYYLLSSDSVLKQYQSFAAGSSVLNLNKDIVAKVRLYIPPSLAEQKKIAKCLTGIDNLIAAQSDNVDALKEKKKGLMQQLFPQDGETTPRLRFPGFEGEWIEKSIEELYRRNIVKNDLSFGVDKIISVANMYYKSDAKISDDDYLRSYNIFRFGDIAFEGNKSPNYAFGRFVENTIGDGIVSHVFDVYSPISPNHCLEYWKYAINYEPLMRPILEKSTKKTTMMTNLVAKDFLKQTILVPSLAEQQKIAECLSALDDQIAAETEKLEALKNHKRGLMQQLFPQPDNK